MLPRLPRATLFPYTTLFRSYSEDAYIQALNVQRPGALADYVVAQLEPPLAVRQEILELLDPATRLRRDRKSTRLNSSHLGISYAVFCLKKKRQKASCVHLTP